MPKLNKIQTSKLKRARSASLVRHASPRLRSRNKTPDLTGTAIVDSSSTMKLNPDSSFQIVPNNGNIGLPPHITLYQQYKDLLPRVKPVSFRLNVLRQFYYFNKTLKFSRNQSLFHVSQLNMIGQSTIELWLKNFKEAGTVSDFSSDNRRGPEPIFDSDELIRLDDFIIQNSISIQDGLSNAGCSLTVNKIAQWVEETLLKTVSETTIREALSLLNYQWSDSSVPDARASYNKIGHDRTDVVEYRQNIFLDRFISFNSCQDHIFICQDESMFACNMHSPYFYVKFDDDGKKWASTVQKRHAQKKTTRGQTYSLMVSGYMTRDGFLKETLTTIKRGGIYGHRTYCSEEFLSDFVDAIKVCKQKFPNKKLVFLFDNAPSHKTKTSGISSESIQTWNGNGPTLEHFDYSSKESFLRSRNLWKTDFDLDPEPPKPTILISATTARLKPAHFRTLADWRSNLRIQWKDWRDWERKRKAKVKLIDSLFLNSVTWKNFSTQIEEISEKNNVSILFTPFYHAELNPIEIIWGRLKQKMRYHQLSSIKSISDKLPEFIDEINHDGFCSKAFRRVFARIVNYKKFGHLKLSYYEYKNLVLTLSDKNDPWSPENLANTSDWLLETD